MLCAAGFGSLAASHGTAHAQTDGMVGTATLSVSPSTVTEGGTVTVTVTFTSGSFPLIGTVVLSEEHGEETGSIGGPDGNSLLYKEGHSLPVVSLGTPGETTGSVDLTVRGDEFYSGDREVRISAAVSGTPLGSAMLTVEDDEAKPILVVAVDPPSRSVEEGDDFTLTVSITGRVVFANDQSIGLVLTGSTATSGADYEAPAATLTLAGRTLSATTTIATIEDTDLEGDETFALRVEHGGDVLYDQPLTIEDDDHPTVTSLDITSDPATDGNYTAGEIVEVTVEFSREVAVTGAPRIPLQLGGPGMSGERFAGWSSSTATSTSTLVFTYPVVAADESHAGGISIEANSLDVNGGTISAAGTTISADLGHSAVAADGTHRVNYQPPSFVSVHTSPDGSEVIVTFSETLDTANAPAADRFTVKADGTALTLSGMPAISGHTVTLTLATAVTPGQAVTVSYTDPTAGDDAAAVQDEVGNDANSFTDKMVGPAPATVTITAETGPVVVNAYHSADFMLERSGPTDAELEVTVAITQTDPYTIDTRPWPATFGAGSSQATLSLPVVGIGQGVLQSGTMIATVQSREGYVVGNPGSAELSMLVLDPVMHIGSAQSSLSVDEDVGRATVELVATSVEGAPAPNDDYPIRVTLSTMPSSPGDNAATASEDYVHITDEFVFGASDFQIENERWVARIQAGTVIHDDELHEGEETFVYRLARSGSLGGAIQILEPRSITVTIVDDDPPEVESVALTSTPGGDATYAIGDTVEATVTFLGAVTVDTTGGRPGLELDFDGTAKPAAYDSGSGSTALVFTYEVAENDADADGIAIAANRLTLNLGTITASSDTMVSAVLTHAAVPTQAGHRVDAVRPTLSSAATASDGASIVLTFSEPLDEDNGPSDTDFTVNVEGSAAALSGPPAVSGGTATLTLATAVTFGQAVTVGYTDPTAGNDANALHDTAGNDADSFTGEAVTNAVPASNDATLRTLAVSDGGAAVPLTPAFDPATTVYRASVTNAVATVTVTATANDEDAEVAFLDEGGAALPDADRNTPEHQVTLDVGDNLIQARVTAENSATTTTYTVTVTRRVAAPAVVSVALTSDPDATGPDDDTYAIDDMVRATVTFSAAVTVDDMSGASQPMLELDFDGTAKPAAFDSGSGSTALVFTYQVAEDDADADGIAIGANRLTLNGGTITASSDTLVGAVLTHPAVPADAGHRVDAVRPTLTGASVNRRELILTWSEALNEGSVPGGEAFTVHVTGGTAPIVLDVSVSGMTATLFLSAPVSSTDTVTLDYAPPIPDPLQEVQSTLPFEDEAGNDAEAFTARTVTNDTSAPTVVSVALTSDPDATGPDDDTYAIDDMVRATVTFSAAVTVDDMSGASQPMLELDFDGTAKPAAYDSGSGSTALVFRYQVAENDADADGIAIGANRLTLNGGTLTASSDTLVDAVLTHAAVSAAAAHRVDGVRPTLSSAATASDGASIVLTFSEPLDEDNGPLDTDFTVNVDGSAAALSGPPAVSGGTATLTLATAVTFGQAVTVGYTDPTAGNDASALQDTVGNDADSFTGEAVANAVPASNDATLRTLAVSDGGAAVPLTPAFDPATTVYRASVTNAVATVTVTATANDEDAEVAFLDEGGAALPDADRNTPEHQVTLDVGDNLIQARVTAENSATTTTYTVTVTRRVAAPAVVSVALASDPDATGPDDDTYAIDDMVRATVTFSAAVTVDTTGGRPGLELDFDGTAKPAAYDSGSGSTALVFTYQVAEDDADADGIAIAANRLTLNRGTITASSDTLVGAVLTHPAVPAQAAHRVDGVRPTLTGASVNRRELTLTWSEALNEGSTPGGEAFTVHVTGGTAPSVTDVSVRGMAATLVLSAPVSSTDTVTLDYTPPLSNPFEDEAGNGAGAFTARTVTNDTSAPAVVSVALTSDPDATGPDDDTYAIDDVVRATVTFSEAVTVDTTGGRPGLELDFNGTAKPAAYDSGSGSTALVFTYQVAENDADADGIAIAANRLTLNLGTITASSDTLVGAVLTHAAVPAQAAHRVDGVRPTLSSAASASDGASIVLTLSEPLDEDNGPSDTDFTVNVDGSAAALSGPPAVSGRTATLTLATAVTFGQAVTVGYTDPTAGNDANALQDTVGNDADSFTGEAVANAVPASNDRPFEPSR